MSQKKDFRSSVLVCVVALGACASTATASDHGTSTQVHRIVDIESKPDTTLTKRLRNLSNDAANLLHDKNVVPSVDDEEMLKAALEGKAKPKTTKDLKKLKVKQHQLGDKPIQVLNQMEYYESLSPSAPQEMPPEPEKSKEDWQKEITHFFKTTKLSGNLNVDFAARKPGYKYEPGISTTLRLGSASLKVSKGFTDWLHAFASVSYADAPMPAVQASADNKLSVDQAYLSINNKKVSNYYAIIGHDYVPFGVFRHHTLTSSLTKSLSDMKRTVILGGYESKSIYGAAFIYNNSGADGTVGSKIVNPKLRNYGFEIGRAHDGYDYFYNVSVSYISDMLEVDTISAVVAPVTKVRPTGLAIHTEAAYKQLGVSFDYITALRKFNLDGMNYNFGDPTNFYRAKPKALTGQIFYNLKLFDKLARLAVGYQQSNQALALSIPRRRFTANAWIDYSKHIQFEAEYQRNMEYAKNKFYVTSNSVVDAESSELPVAQASDQLVAVYANGKQYDAFYVRMSFLF